jgi:type I restriction enzyme S subunit
MPLLEGSVETTLGAISKIDRIIVAPERLRGGVAYVGLEHIDGEFGEITAAMVHPGELRSAKFAFSPEHVLFGKLRPYLHKVARPDFEGVCSTDILPILPSPEVDRGYLFHLLRSPAVTRFATTRSVGVNLPRISPSTLLALPILLPPITEQRRIAAIIDKSDGVSRKRRKSISLLHQFLRSSFLDVFGDPVRNDRAWPQMVLSEIASVERGKFSPRPRNDPRYYGGSYPFVQTGDISRSDGTVRQWHQTLNETGTAVSRSFPRGTIAMAIAANIGDTAIVDFDFYCPDSVVCISARSQSINPEYLEYCLRFFKKRLEAAAPKTAQRNINLTVIRPLPLPVPPIELQTRFATLRRHLTHLTQRYGRGLLELERLHRSLSHEAFLSECSLGSLRAT